MTVQYPVIITVRDRVSPLKELLSWLEKVRQTEIWLCDNASTYPPMVEFLKNTRYKVMYNNFNLGHRAPWLSGLVPDLGSDRYFIVTDPDVVPTSECPLDALDYLRDMLAAHPDFDKVGFSLRIDDIPDHYVHKSDVITWESQFWMEEFASGLFLAPIDTTFSMYRPGSGHMNSKSLRAAPPYSARHLPWYQDSKSPTPEETYYAAHADPLISNWNFDKLPANVRVKLQKLRTSSAQKTNGSDKQPRMSAARDREGER